MAETTNLLPESKIANGQLKTCSVEITRYRRETFEEVVEKTSRIVKGSDIKDRFAIKNLYFPLIQHGNRIQKPVNNQAG